MPFSDILIRILLAILIGGAIGYEREFKNRPAGFRTHILVCIGATIISLIQVTMVNDTIAMAAKNPELADLVKVDYARLGAQVISGVGFLGAGTILHTKGSVKGLTTAASIWVVACVGLAIGMGYYMISIASGVAVVVVLVGLKRFQNKFITQKELFKIEIHYINDKKALEFIERCFEIKSVKIKNIEFAIEDEEELFENSRVKTCLYTITSPKFVSINEILNYLTTSEDILKVSEIDD